MKKEEFDIIKEETKKNYLEALGCASGCNCKQHPKKQAVLEFIDELTIEKLKLWIDDIDFSKTKEQIAYELTISWLLLAVTNKPVASDQLDEHIKKVKNELFPTDDVEMDNLA